MKRIVVVAILVMVIAALVLGVSTAMAAKQQNVIARSNGFPSGEHFNLNIHGKDWTTCQATADNGGSVFVPEYGEATIQYVTNKKSSVGNLTVLDPCAGFSGDNDVAQVQLPYEALGYHVFGRILAKPNNGSGDSESSVILYPNVIRQACNDTGDPDFGEYTSCDLALGLMVGTNLYYSDPEQYVRFDPAATPGKGNSRATDITRLFTYTGWAVNPILDVNVDGVIDQNDVPADAIGYVPDLNGDVSIDVEEWLKYNANLDIPMAWYFQNEWIFNVADLVVTEQGLYNDGTKLLQIRFYPVDTTEFAP